MHNNNNDNSSSDGFPDGVPDEERLLALEAEIPILSSVRGFTERAIQASWFAELGEAHSPQVQQLARAYLDALGYPQAEARPVLNWDDALNAAASLDLNNEGWEVEEQLRAGLVNQVLGDISEEGMGVMLAHLAAQAAPVLSALAEEVVMMTDMPPDLADENVLDLMVGAGQQAVFGAAWAIAAEAVAAEAVDNENIDINGSHPLLLKFRLFELGHWPLGLAGQSLNLF